MDITVSLQIKITFDGNKKVSVGNVATAVKGLGLEQKVTEAVIERVDEELIEKYCGGKYARGNSKKRYQRAGSVERHPVTSVGKLNLRLHRVRDKEEEKIFLPVEDRVNLLVALKRGSEAIGAGNLDHKVKVKTGDELEDLANSFNKMASDLKRYTKELVEKGTRIRELEIERLEKYSRNLERKVKMLEIEIDREKTKKAFSDGLLTFYPVSVFVFTHTGSESTHDYI